MLRFATALALILPTLANTQSLTPEEIAAMVDQKLSDLNPYQELLNNSDPARSLAAMQIMLDSHDADLTRMALDYGLLSPNPTVQRTAFEGLLGTKPILSIRFDASEVDDGWLESRMREWNGSLDTDRIGYWRIGVGEYSDTDKCFLEPSRNDCFITVNADGIFLTPRNMNARASISEAGMIEGEATLHQVSSPVPFSIRLLD